MALENREVENKEACVSRSEQELLEEEIKDVRDQNSKSQIQVNKSLKTGEISIPICRTNRERFLSRNIWK